MSAIAAGAPPRRTGSFEVLREIGQGGMGVVYLARQPTLDRLVVLKKIRKELLVDPNMLERFQREARSAAAVHHHNVVGVYDCFEARGDHYIAQEFVEGKDLRSVMAQLGRLEPGIAAFIALEIARGLEEIHARGIVHRDLKPANILIGSSGDTKIADFGIAVEGKADGLTRPGVLVGSIPYMAPEQILGQRADQRTDIFLFGTLLFEMVTGVPPYRCPEGEPLEDLLERMRSERYVATRKLAPGTPLVLARLIRRCLRARPARRIASVSDARRILERMLGRPSTHDSRSEIAGYLWEREVFTAAEGSTAVQPAGPKRRRTATRRHVAWGLAAVAVLTLVLAGLWIRAPFLGVDGRLRPPASTPAAGAPAVAVAAPAPAPAPPVVVVPIEPARVRFVADPWAEIRVDDRAGFFTPRDAALELTPGEHRVVFEHPRFGRAELVVELEAGETRTIRHAFTRDALPGAGPGPVRLDTPGSAAQIPPHADAGR